MNGLLHLVVLTSVFTHHALAHQPGVLKPSDDGRYDRSSYQITSMSNLQKVDVLAKDSCGLTDCFDEHGKNNVDSRGRQNVSGRLAPAQPRTEPAANPDLSRTRIFCVCRTDETTPNGGGTGTSRLPEREIIRNYRAYIACGPEVAVWYGRRVALILDGETDLTQRNPETMKTILKALDDVFDAFDRVTGRRPRLTAPLKGRIRIEVSDKVGGGLAHHGRLGVGIGDGFFKGLYKRFQKGEHTVDQVFFYETARNYWMADMNPAIDYHTSKRPQDYGWWTVGFKNAMSIFLPAEVSSIEDMYYFGSNGQRFSDGMELNLNTYLAAPDKYNWDNSWNVPLVPWKERTSVNDLMTGLLIRLHRDHGGIDFIRRLYAEIPKRQPLKSRADRQGARDNFYHACSIAAQQDLYEFFTEELRWNISAACHDKVVTEVTPK